MSPRILRRLIRLHLLFVFTLNLLLLGPNSAIAFSDSLNGSYGFYVNAKSDFVNIDYLPVDLDIKYATTSNFTGMRLYPSSAAYLRQGTADKLKAVCDEIAKDGYHLKIWDAYRPPSVQFILWQKSPDSRYIANPYHGVSKHSRGTAVDLTLVDRHNRELEMPSGFDEFSAQADRNYQDVSTLAKKNAEYLEQVMRKHGFTSIQTEWWHFDDKDEYPLAVQAEPKPAGTSLSRKLAPQQLQPTLQQAQTQLRQDGTSESGIITLTLSAIGDNVLGSDPRFAYKGSFNEVYDLYGPAYFFEKVEDILKSDDLTIANLETTLTTETRTPDKSFQSAPFFFKGMPAYAHILRAGGIEVVNLANNHTMDYLEQGYYDTISALYRANIESCGYDRIARLTLKGVKTAILGYNLLGPLETDIDIPALKQQIQNDILKVKQESGLVVVNFHWGRENSSEPDQQQIELSRLAIDYGADLVLGHHPHVIQPLEKYKGKYIVYSLGNFSFGGNPRPWYYDTFIYRQTFAFKNGTLVQTLAPEVIPCSVSSLPDRNDYRPAILTGSEAKRVLQALKYPNDKAIAQDRP